MVVSGEITTTTYVDVPSLVRKTIERIGYTRAKYGFDAETCGDHHRHPRAVSRHRPGRATRPSRCRVDPGDEDALDCQGAGDQGMMFGYACRDTDELMPMPILLAHRLVHRVSEVRKGDVMPYLRPDGKSQVTVKYRNGKPEFITAVVLSTPARDGIDIDTLMRPDLIEHVIRPVLPEGLYDPEFKKTKLYVNPTGKFVIGGPMGDTGLTGRKIIVDTYGGWGGTAAALLGQGPVEGRPLGRLRRPLRGQERRGRRPGRPLRGADRLRHRRGPSGQRHGRVLRHREGRAEARIQELVLSHFDLRPAAIIRDLELLRPIYEKTAAYGHFGREDADFTWESTDKADDAAQRRGSGLRRGDAASGDRRRRRRGAG